jgi:hypothetical protein
MSVETCCYCDSWDPETLEPMGPTCGAPAVSRIHWVDGRVSPSCDLHGFKSLTRDAKMLVVLVEDLGASQSSWEA